MTDSEARFTAPRPDCPHPERWHSTDDDSTEIEVTVLVAAFVRALQPDLVIETGAAFGQTTRAIGEALKANGQGRLISCETNKDRLQIARTRVDDLPVEVMGVPSLEMIAAINEPVGFAWFDSLINLRIREYLALRKWLRPGSFVGFHDTGPQHGYRPLVDRLGRDRWLRLVYLPTPRGVSFGEVLR